MVENIAALVKTQLSINDGLTESAGCAIGVATVGGRFAGLSGGSGFSGISGMFFSGFPDSPDFPEVPACKVMKKRAQNERKSFFFHLSEVTHNKKILKKSPLHHHFEVLGWNERDIVKMFWTIGLFLAMAAITYGVWL